MQGRKGDPSDILDQETKDFYLRALDILARRGASLRLAHSLIAAKLNIGNGSDAALIGSTILQADIALSGFQGKLPYSVPMSSDAAQPMLAAAAALDAFNSTQMRLDCASGAPSATSESGASTLAVPIATVEVQVGNVVVEGPIQFVNGNLVTVLGVAIRVDPEDSLLSSLTVGTNVRVEGAFDAGNILNAVSISLPDTLVPAVTPETSFNVGAVSAPAATPEASFNSGSAGSSGAPAPAFTPEPGFNGGVPAPASTPEVRGGDEDDDGEGDDESSGGDDEDDGDSGMGD